MENKSDTVIYTEEQLMARLRFFIGVCLALTLTGIVFVVLYSLIFVTQPLNAISPIDQKFFELIVPIATFLTGTLSGIMLAGGDKDSQKEALKAANKGWDKPSTPPAPVSPTGPIQPFSMNPLSPTGSFGTNTSMMPGNTMAPNSTMMPIQNNAPMITSFGGKPGPAPAPEPEI